MPVASVVQVSRWPDVFQSGPGEIAPEPFEEFHGRDLDLAGELVVFPGFNDLSGGTWVNVSDADFLAPFLPAGLEDGQAYLLDGTRLGDFRRV